MALNHLDGLRVATARDAVDEDEHVAVAQSRAVRRVALPHALDVHAEPVGRVAEGDARVLPAFRAVASGCGSCLWRGARARERRDPETSKIRNRIRILHSPNTALEGLCLVQETSPTQ